MLPSAGRFCTEQTVPAKCFLKLAEAPGQGAFFWDSTRDRVLLSHGFGRIFAKGGADGTLKDWLQAVVQQQYVEELQSRFENGTTGSCDIDLVVFTATGGVSQAILRSESNSQGGILGVLRLVTAGASAGFSDGQTGGLREQGTGKSKRDREGVSNDIFASRMPPAVTIDPSGKVVGWNPGAQGALGCIWQSLAEALEQADADGGPAKKLPKVSSVRQGSSGAAGVAATAQPVDMTPPENAAAGTPQLLRSEEQAVKPETSHAGHSLRGLIETASAPVFAIDKDGLVTEWNLRCSQMTGYTREEVAGKDLLRELVSPPDRESARALVDGALLGQRTGGAEFKLSARGDKVPRILLRAAIRIRDENGRNLGVIAVVEDNTARRAPLQAAKDPGGEFDPINVPIFGIDKDGLVNEWNLKAAEIFGYTSEEVMGRDLVADFISPEHRQSVREVLDSALRGQEAASFELPLYTENRRRLDLLFSAAARRDGAGNVVGVVGVGHDITQRKKAEHHKEQAARDLRALINTANVPIFGIDRDGLVNEWNLKAAEIFGYTSEEVMGRDLVADFISPEHRQSVRELLQNALEQGQVTSSFELHMQSKGGANLFLLLNANPRHDLLGNIVGVVGVGQDLTEKRRAMEAEVAFSKAKAANDAKSQFLANMSHEMRTPLNGIVGVNQVLLTTNLTPEQRELARLIQSSADSLLRLINDVLDLTRVESGKIRLERVEFDLCATVEKSLDNISVAAARKELEVVKFVDPCLQQLYRGDSERLEQILLNLLSNAVKFTEAGEVMVSVEKDVIETDTQQSLLFKVIDSGIGIPVEEQGKLFARFTQVDASTTRGYGGSGLGLVIVKQLVELMGGTIGVQSRPSQGSTFWFTILLEKVQAEADAPSFPACKPVIVYTQNAMERTLMTRYLKAWGLPTEEVPRFGEVHDYIVNKANDFKAAIISIPSTQPSQDNDVTQRLAELANSATGLENVIVLSPLSVSHSIRGMGCSWTVLIKPVKQAQLLASLQRACDGDDSALTRLHRWPSGSLGNGLGASQRLRVLIVVDNSMSAQWIRKAVSRAGCICDIASHGAEALDALKRFAFHLVLMDLVMPVMDGAAATRELRKLEAATGRPNVPVVGLYTNPADKEICIGSGMDDAMQKPIDCDLLTGLLRTLAHGTGARPGKLDVVAAETSRRVSAMQSNLGRDARNSAGGSSEPQVPISMPATDDLLPGSCGPVLLRILIADGDGANQLVTKRLLRTVCKSHAGVEPEIIQVRGGCEAVAAVGKHSLDLVLMDINMPVANGVAAAAEIRRRHPPSTLPIIGLAASADSRPESRWSIFSQVALKPLTPADLESILRQHVKRLQQTSYKQTESQPVPSQLPQGAASVSETRTAQEPAACEGKSARPGGKELDSHSHASDVAARARGRNAVNVLVADDSAANQMAIKRIVRKSGRQLLSNDPNIRTVRDGAEALGAISKGRFDIVLMDVHMPNMNGIEAMRRIRKQYGPEDLPVIALTGSDGRSSAGLENAGFNEVAFKPLSAEVLTNLFKKHLRCLRSSAGEAFEAPGLPRSLARRPAREDMGFLGTSSPDASTPSSRPLLCPWSSASHQQDMPDKSSEIFRDHRDKFSSSQPSQAPVAEPAGCQVPQDDDRITCLVAEDDRVSMMMMKKLLEKANMKMIPALNGVEAVVAAMEKPVDIILMDCNMPLKDGWQATRAIRAWEAEHNTRRTPIVAVTANAMLGDRRKCLDCGMDDYMSKPVQKAVLIETINKWVKPGETGHATAPSALDDLPRGTVGRTVEVTSSPPPLQQPSVLLVDESIDRLLYVKWVLENEGLVVDTAENGIHAVQLLGGGSSKYQAVMVALGLQLMTTTSVRDELSKPNLQAGDRKLRVILLRDASHENVQVPNLNTVHGILDLPIQTEQLRSVLEGICPGAAAHRQSPPSTSSMPSRSISTDLLWRRSLIGRHVLLIEDNHSMQGAIMQMLQLEGLVVDAISEEARCSQGIPSAGQYDMALLNNLTTATVAAIKAIKTSQPHLPVICICRVTTMTGGRKFSPDWVLSSRNLHRAAIMEAIYKLTVDRPRSSPAIEPHAKMPKAPLDVKVALDLYDGDWDFVQDLLDCFLEGEREHVAELMEAELRCDLGRIKFLAHALRGSTGSCCMAAATEMFAQLEEICNRTLSGGPNAPTEYPQHIVSVCCGVSQQLYLNAAAFKVWLGGLKALEIAPGLACAGGDFDKLMDAMLVMMQSATSAICGESNEAIDDADLVACITSTPFAEQAAPRLHAAALAHQLSCTGRDESMSKIKAELRKLEADLCGLQTFRGLG